MPNWEYKIITSGALGFASPSLLEQHLNQLGKEEWEIINFQTRPDNPLAFHGLARRPVMRDWNVEPAAAAMPAGRNGALPAPPEEKSGGALNYSELRAEAEERRESLLASEESLRPIRDGDEPDDEAGEHAEIGDDDAVSDEEVPTFFEAIRPHMHRNQRGPGMAVGIDFLAKKFEQTQADLVEALKECGFAIPSSAKEPPAYLEFDGDLYWLNLNNRGQLWINTREKPRARFKPVQAHRVEEEAPAAGEPAPAGEPPAAAPAPAAEAAPAAKAPVPLPEGPALLDRIRPVMRRNRRGGGLSGSVNYLTRSLRTEPAALEAAFAALGLVLFADPKEKPVFVEIGEFVYWLNRDNSGQIWINARHRREAPDHQAAPSGPASAAGEPASPAGEPAPAPAPEAAAPAAAPASPLATVRPLLVEARRGAVGAGIEGVASRLGQASEALIASLIAAGLKVPEKTREKPVFAGHAGELFWFSRSAKGELSINAKPAEAEEKPEAEKPAGEAPPAKPAGRRPRRSRS